MKILPISLIVLALVIGSLILVFAWRLTQSTKMSDEKPYLRVFFYGLYMNSAYLRRHGYSPRVLGRARLPDFALRIGDRATLVPRKGATCYGVVMELPQDEVSALYSTATVADYQAESVPAILDTDGLTVDSACFNLAEEKLGISVNAEYVRQLSELAGNLGFPAEYLREIAALEEG